MDSSILNGSRYHALIKGGTARLGADRAEINDLNVFPIPDGDTGDNMYMTIRSGMQATDGSGALGEVASAVAKGMLMGARGNSGVILSRIFAGIADGLAGCEEADAATFVSALGQGVKKAYGSVTVPVEGTILTVCRESCEQVAKNISPNASLRDILASLCEYAAVSLEHTPELLDVLKEAGVVDSGGAGLLSVFKGMLASLDGEQEVSDSGSEGAKQLDLSLFTEDSVLEFGYCTEFLLRLQRAKTDIDNFDTESFTAHLNMIGDSVVCFRDGSIIKVHIHTKTPSEVLSYGQLFGEFLTLKIKNMTLQHNGVKQKEEQAKKPRKPHKKYGVVTVASGDGIVETLYAMGSDAVIDGGQSMNPSASDFIKAFEDINADTILVFPGNSNIILTAKQASELYEGAEIRVVKCRSVCETYAALSMLDTSSGDTDSIISEVESFLGEVVSAGISRTNKDTESNGVEVKSGDYIGFSGGKVITDDPIRIEAAKKLCEKLSAGDFGLLLLICGRDADEAEAKELFETLKKAYRRTEIVMIDGGQPIHDYMLLLE